MSRILYLSWQSLALVSILSGLTGCAAGLGPTGEDANAQLAPPTPSTMAIHPALAAAERLLGAPYRYGGAAPRGFDCSGLVYYVHKENGVAVPRTAREQRRQSQPVNASSIRPGDLLFFSLSARKASHVGIYAGSGRFIHAPSSGGRVSYARLDDPYWRERLIGAGRFF